MRVTLKRISRAYIKSLQSLKWAKCLGLEGNALSPSRVWPAPSFICSCLGAGSSRACSAPKLLRAFSSWNHLPPAPAQGLIASVSVCLSSKPSLPALAAGSRGSPAVPAVPGALRAPSPYLLLRAGPRSPPGIQVVQRRVRSDKILTAFGIHLWRMTLVPQKSLWCTGNS